MVFSSTVFLFLFLPLVLGLYFVVARPLRNGVLLLASLVYYGWGEPAFLRIVLASVALNYVLGLLVGRFRQGIAGRVVMVAAVGLNIGLLAYFKYANFVVQNLNDLGAALDARAPLLTIKPVVLPLGISFTFHALSYVIDIYRGQAPAQKNPVLLGLYILFFPQLVAGPIVRYHEISDQLARRRVTLEGFAAGVQRFVIGLGKKVLIANVVAEMADAVFQLPQAELTAGLAWLGVVSYALQIYFDFSAYSDMAIGLALLFGFKFPENFAHPYISTSITEFWRRWHISLSRWFRDYLYIPLGGNRVPPLRLYANLVTVFFLCGLWHGASWTFVVWGLIHGAFLVFERTGGGALLASLPRPVRHLYTLAVVLLGWVFFRADSFASARNVLEAMVGLGPGAGLVHRAGLLLTNNRAVALAAGVIGSAPWLAWLAKRGDRLADPVAVGAWQLGKVACLLVVLVACAMRLSSGTYNPFIYFRF